MVWIFFTRVFWPLDLPVFINDRVVNMFISLEIKPGQFPLPPPPPPSLPNSDTNDIFTVAVVSYGSLEDFLSCI